jgi:hypothetical protein
LGSVTTRASRRWVRPCRLSPDCDRFFRCRRISQRANAETRVRRYREHSAPARGSLDRGTFSTIFCSRRRRFVAAPYPTDDGNHDHSYRSKSTHSGEAAAKALARTQYSEQEENTPCRSVDLIEAVAEAPILSNKAPSSFLCSHHRAISRVDEPLCARRCARLGLPRSRARMALPAHRLRARSDGIMIRCGPILGKGLSAAHPSRIGDWDSSPISLPTGFRSGSFTT